MPNTPTTRIVGCLVLLLAISRGAPVVGAAQAMSPDSPRLVALEARLAGGAAASAAALDAFWAEMAERTTPLVEPLENDLVLVTFLWRESEPLEQVAVIGGPGGMIPGDNLMMKLADSDVWYRSYRVRNDLRTVYQLSPDDSLVPFSQATDFQARMAELRPDPLNPKTFVFRRNPAYPGSVDRIASVVELPGADPQPWIEPRAGVAPGALEDHEVASLILDNERTVTVYTPAGYDAGRSDPYPLLVVFDRLAYLRLVPTPTILDNLIAAGEIPPLVAVLVGNVDRSGELPCDEPFSRFLTDELLPWLRDRYAITADPSRIIAAGSSYGGLASSCVAFRHPGVFGNVLSQSGSYWWRPGDDPEHEWLTRQIVERDTAGTRFYLDIGLLESTPTRDDGPSMLVTNRHLRDVLRAKGYTVTYRELNSGHDYVSWRGTLADGLLALMGGTSGAKDEGGGRE